MNAFNKLFERVRSRFSKSAPSPQTINLTGVVLSDWRFIIPVGELEPRWVSEPGKGWLKGFVLECDSMDIVVVAKHCGPSTNYPSNTIFVVDRRGKRIERQIISINSEPFKLDGINIDLNSYYHGGDIAICKVNLPFPKKIKGYGVAKNVKSGAASYTLNQYFEFSEAKIKTSPKLAWVAGENRKKELVAGDSGLPWFVWQKNKWKIISHSTKGIWGEGPNYSSKLIYKEFLKRAADLK